MRESLEYTIVNGRGGTNAVALEKRVFNVNAFANLDRSGLSFRGIERRLLIDENERGEKLYIQYPGKETVSDDENKIRPWDFRPKLLDSNGEFMRDLSFSDIWDDLSEIQTADARVMPILAAVFYRVANMIDYEKIQKDYTFEDVNMSNGEIVDTGTINLEWYAPKFSDEILEYLNDNVNIRNVLFSSYLFYNDLLAQNEDCKYSYRATHVKHEDWNGKTGRVSTMLSHLSVIQFITGRVKFSEIMGRFQRGMGVGSIPIRDIPEITDNIIKR